HRAQDRLKHIDPTQQAEPFKAPPALFSEPALDDRVPIGEARCPHPSQRWIVASSAINTSHLSTTFSPPQKCARWSDTAYPVYVAPGTTRRFGAVSCSCAICRPSSRRRTSWFD